ncbi:retrovirus-related pol polyprotein from transposon TNT 1-94 [Tanacetum coccineum]
MSKERKVNTTSINYVELNRLFEDFGKRFVPEQQLSDEQDSGYKLHTLDQSASSPIKMEDPREIPKLQAKDTTIYKLKEHIKSIRENDKEEKVKHEMNEIETITIELEHSVAKLLYENKRLHKEIKHLKKIYKDQFDSIKKTRALSKEQCDYLISQLNSKSMENTDLKGQIQEKVFVTTALQSELRRIKGKHVNDNATTITNATTISPRMFKLDIESLSHRLKNNRDAHEDYLKKTIENTDTIRGLICPSYTKPSEKLVAVTPMNKVKKVRFSEPLTSSSDIHKQVESSKTSDSNTLVLSSTRLKCSTSTCRSQPTSNKKNDKISQKPSSNNKNKVEAKPRKVNKKNRVKEHIYDANVRHTMLNVNSQLICVKCKQCMFDANHDVCFFDFVNNVTLCSKSKSAKKSQHHNIWRPTGKVFIGVGHKWKPTRRLFTIVGNSFPLTRITPKKIVHLKDTTSNSVEKPKPEIKIAKNWEPNHLWGSNATDVPSSSSLVNDKLSRLFSGSRDTNLYTISLDDMIKTSLIYLLSKASKTKSWLWHRRLSHLNFGKSKKSSHQPKAEDTNQEKLYLLHMDLCGPMRVESINWKRTEFVNQTLRDFYENIGISHQTSVARTPQQNDVVERRNQNLVEAARTIYIKTPYEPMHDKKSDLSFLHVFGSLCYPTNDSEDLGKLNAKADCHTPSRRKHET